MSIIGLRTAGRHFTVRMTALTIAAMGMATAPSAFASASASDRTPAISVGLNAFAAKVETLGEARFPGTFAGATLTSAGVVKVYATSTRDAALTSAIAKLNSGHYRVTYTAAKFSYRKLDALNAALVSHQSRLQKDGVELAISSPDAAAGTVQVTLLRPTRAVLARLSSSGVASPNLGPLTTANYATAASAIISTAVGAGYTVQHALQAQAATTVAPGTVARGTAVPDIGRNAGVAPFAGGDYITSNGLVPYCTGGFSVVGNASGNPFMLTAGHCGRATWSTPAQPMGQTSSLYFKNPARDDFQTIRVGSARGSVNGDTDQYAVIGQNNPARGDLITLDGSISGEEHDIAVIAPNATIYNITAPDGSKFTASYLVEASGFCQGGDSGGPMYIRQPTPLQVVAVGTLVAYFGLPSGGIACAGERITQELKASNTSLIEGANTVP